MAIFGRWLLALFVGSFAVFVLTELMRAAGIRSTPLEVLVGAAVGIFVFFGPPSKWIFDA